MATHNHNGARAPGLAAPEPAGAAVLAQLGAHGAAAAGLTATHKDEARELGSGAGFMGHRTVDSPDCPTARPAAQALQAIEGEAYAAAFLARLRAGQASADNLATLVHFLDGAMLQGACRVIVKALEGKHHA